jgi:hypothetical protein
MWEISIYLLLKTKFTEHKGQKRRNIIKLHTVLEENVYTKTAGFQNSARKYLSFSYSRLLNYFLLNDFPPLSSTQLQLFLTSPFLSLSWNFKTLDSVRTESNFCSLRRSPAEDLTGFWLLQTPDPLSKKANFSSDYRRTV